MKCTTTTIEGVCVLDLAPRYDERGYFTRVFCKDELSTFGIEYDIVQVNRSHTQTKGMIRGMHMQKAPKSEDKIVQCVQGKIYDVAIDMRPQSSTYGKWFGVELSQENKKMLLVPKGCAHGFQTQEEDCVVEYFVTEYYTAQAEVGFRWNDPFFSIAWPIQDALVSQKDALWPWVTV